MKSFTEIKYVFLLYIFLIGLGISYFYFKTTSSYVYTIIGFILLCICTATSEKSRKINDTNYKEIYNLQRKRYISQIQDKTLIKIIKEFEYYCNYCLDNNINFIHPSGYISNNQLPNRPFYFKINNVEFNTDSNLAQTIPNYLFVFQNLKEKNNKIDDSCTVFVNKKLDHQNEVDENHEKTIIFRYSDNELQTESFFKAIDRTMRYVSELYNEKNLKEINDFKKQLFKNIIVNKLTKDERKKAILEKL